MSRRRSSRKSYSGNLFGRIRRLMKISFLLGLSLSLMAVAIFLIYVIVNTGEEESYYVNAKQYIASAWQSDTIQSSAEWAKQNIAAPVKERVLATYDWALAFAKANVITAIMIGLWLITAPLMYYDNKRWAKRESTLRQAEISIRTCSKIQDELDDFRRLVPELETELDDLEQKLQDAEKNSIMHAATWDEERHRLTQEHIEQLRQHEQKHEADRRNIKKLITALEKVVPELKTLRKKVAEAGAVPSRESMLPVLAGESSTGALVARERPSFWGKVRNMAARTLPRFLLTHNMREQQKTDEMEDLYFALMVSDAISGSDNTRSSTSQVELSSSEDDVEAVDAIPFGFEEDNPSGNSDGSSLIELGDGTHVQITVDIRSPRGADAPEVSVDQKKDPSKEYRTKSRKAGSTSTSMAAVT